MMKKEFLEWMNERKGNACGYAVLINGEVINNGNTEGSAEMGCRFINNKWQVYEPQERGTDIIRLETTNEGEAFNKLVERVKLVCYED